MNTSSTKSQTFVKPKSQENRHFSTHQSSQLNEPAAGLCECSQSGQDGQDSDLGADDGFVLEFDIGIIDAKYEHRGISLTARYILGIIAAYLSAHSHGYLSEDKIAQAAGCNRSTVIRAVNKLKAAGYLDVDRRGKCNRYHVCEWVKHLPKTWVNHALVRDDDLSICQAVFVSYVKFRQGNNLATWLKIREAAEALGVSYHTIARAAASDAVLGFIGKIHRPERRSSKNEYYSTEESWLETYVFGPKTARPKCSALGQTSRKGDYPYARFTRHDLAHPQLGLSFDCRLDQEPYEVLRNIGVHWKVAKPMAVQWRDDHDSVRQAAVNAALRGDDYCRRMQRLGLPAPRFNLAGYTAATLNGAHRECHDVGPSKLTRVAKARAPAGARAAAGCRPTESELKRLEKYAENELKPCLVKPHTPDKSAIPADNPQFRDKSTEDEYLQAAIAAARRRSYSCRKHAKLGQKLHISVNSCH